MMNHMMDDPMVAMMFLLGLVVLLAAGFIAVRVYGEHQREAVPARAATPATATAIDAPESPRSLDQ